MTQEEQITFEIAKKLKEKGFREKCFAYYDDDSIEYNHESKMFNCELFMSHNSYDNIWHRDYIDAPTISQVLKWLREEKELHIEIYMYHNCYLFEIYNTKIYDVDFTQKSEKYSEIEYENYEQAALAGIEYVLDNLI